jgi:paraquat-inducible protein A
VTELWAQGKPELAVLVFATAIAAPLLQISLLLYVLVPIRLGRLAWQVPRVFRLLRHVQPWSMMEVFMLGILVSLVKLAGMAEIVPGLALWSFALLIVALAGAVASLDPDVVWSRVEIAR